MKLNKENSFQFLNVKNGRIVFFLRECSRINLTIYIILLLKNILKVVVDTLTKRKIENPTPIQMQAIIFLGVSARSCYLSVFMFLFGACPFVSSFVLLFFLSSFVLFCPLLILYPYPVLILSGSILCLVTSFVFCFIFCSFHQNPESKNVADQDQGRIQWFTPENVPPFKALRREKS